MMKVPSRNDEVSQVTSPLNVFVWVFMFVLAFPLCWVVRVPVLYISHPVKILCICYIYVFFWNLPFLDLTYVHYIHILSWSIQVCRHKKVLPSQLLRTLDNRGLEELRDIKSLASSVKASSDLGNAKIPPEDLTTDAWSRNCLLLVLVLVVSVRFNNVPFNNEPARRKEDKHERPCSKNPFWFLYREGTCFKLQALFWRVNTKSAEKDQLQVGFTHLGPHRWG